MKIAQLEFAQEFAVITGNGRAQAAVMVLEPHDSTGGPDNRHRGADQWLYVARGEGEAIVEGKSHALRPGVLLLIERGEAHEIKNSSQAKLETLNFYVPPAYSPEGETLPPGEG